MLKEKNDTSLILENFFFFYILTQKLRCIVSDVILDLVNIG